MWAHQILFQFIWIQWIWSSFLLVRLTLRDATFITAMWCHKIAVFVRHISLLLISFLFLLVSSLDDLLTAFTIGRVVRNIPVWLAITIKSINSICSIIFLFWRTSVGLFRLTSFLARPVKLDFFCGESSHLFRLHPLCNTCVTLDCIWVSIHRFILLWHLLRRLITIDTPTCRIQCSWRLFWI